MNLLEFCCTWKEKEKHQDNVPVKICYHHSFSILFFHTFTADPLIFWSTSDANTAIVKPFRRTSWSSTFTKTILFSGIVICVIQFPAILGDRILWKYFSNLSNIFSIKVLFLETEINSLNASVALI